MTHFYQNTTLDKRHMVRAGQTYERHGKLGWNASKY
jgi:hypothetical protein